MKKGLRVYVTHVLAGDRDQAMTRITLLKEREIWVGHNSQQYSIGSVCYFALHFFIKVRKKQLFPAILYQSHDNIDIH